jgi:hypothetical protein
LSATGWFQEGWWAEWWQEEWWPEVGGGETPAPYPSLTQMFQPVRVEPRIKRSLLLAIKQYLKVKLEEK